METLEALSSEVRIKTENRARNLPGNVEKLWKEFEDNKKNLKSDLKKANSFLNKLKIVNAEGIQQCIRDADILNLGFHVLDIVGVIMDTNYRMPDVPAIAKLCGSLHRKYREFSSELIGKLKHSILSPVKDDDTEAFKKKRIQIRFTIELFDEGVFADEQFFVTLLNFLLKRGNKALNSRPGNIDLISLQIFLKYGGQSILGIPSKACRDLANECGISVKEIPFACFSSTDIQSSIITPILEIFNYLVNETQKLTRELSRQERRMEKSRLLHGSLIESKQQELDTLVKNKERYLSSATIFAEALGRDLPDFQQGVEEDETGDVKVSTSVWDGGNSSALGSEVQNSPFVDLETRAFYEEFPDLLSMVPSESFGFTPDHLQALKEKLKMPKSYDNESANDFALLEMVNKLSNASNSLSNSSIVVDNIGDLEKNDEGMASVNDASEESSAAGNDSFGSKIAPLEEELLQCNSRFKCDEFCVRFCFANSKATRNRIALYLSRIPYDRSDLPPYFARILATLSRIFPDMSKATIEGLTKELHFLTNNKTIFSPRQLETKLKIMRYLGELIKFGVVPPIVPLRAIEGFLNYPSAQNIELLASILESCGRYLYFLPVSRDILEKYLQTMMRIRKSTIVDLRVQHLIDFAYFSVIPHRSHKKAEKKLCQLEKYIKFMIFECLGRQKCDIDALIQSFSRLPFNQPPQEMLDQTMSNSNGNAVESFIVKCVMRQARFKYSCIERIADLLSGINAIRPGICAFLLDCIQEEIFRGLDSPYKRDPQRMIGITRLLGELFNFKVVSAKTLLFMLYSFIHYGYSKDLMTSGSLTSSLGMNTATNSSSSSASSMTSSSSSNNGNNSNSRFTSIFKNGNRMGYTNFALSHFIGASLSGSKTINTDKSNGNPNHAILKNLALFSGDPSRFDPMIPIDIDPPGDSFRIQLVVELINAVGEFFVSGSNKKKLGEFLVFFQRYLRSKPTIPMHVEFAIRDMYDHLEEEMRNVNKKVTPESSKYFQVFLSTEDINQLVSAIEESRIGLDGNGEDSDDEKAKEGEENEENTNEKHDESDNSDDSDAEEDQLSHSFASKMHQDKSLLEQEDQEFESLIKSIIQEGVESSKKGGRAGRVNIPAVLPKPKNLHLFEEDSKLMDNKVPMKLLSRDSRGRMETRQMWVPKDNPMVQSLAEHEKASKLEQQLLKQKTLQLEMLSEQEQLEAEEDEEDQEGRPNTWGHSSSSSFSTYRGGNHRRHPPPLIRQTETRRDANDLNLEEFLAESSAAEMKQVNAKQRYHR